MPRRQNHGALTPIRKAGTSMNTGIRANLADACLVVLGAATFGFVAAGFWYQYCLSQGQSEAAAAFAAIAPPPASTLPASLALAVAVGAALSGVTHRPAPAKHDHRSRAVPDHEHHVPADQVPADHLLIRQ